MFTFGVGLLGMEPKAFYLIGKCSTMELYPSSVVLFFSFEITFCIFKIVLTF